MSSSGSWSRSLQLVIVAGMGLAVGYAVVTLLRPEADVPGLSPAGTPAPVAGTLEQPPESQGSSVSVVGGMTREEMRDLGLSLADEPEAPAPALRPDAGGVTPPAALAGDDSGPPVALGFSPEVRRVAEDFLCLCGCPHRLSQCPCNDQPIGAGTMLAYLEKLVGQSEGREALRAGMIDRYGERVVAPVSTP